MKTDEIKTILDSIPELVVHHGKDMRIKWVNKAAVGSVNSEPQDLMGKSWCEIWQCSERQHKRCPVYRAWKSGQKEEGKITMPDGRIWLTKANPFYRNNEIAGIVEISEKITGKKRVLKALIEGDEILKSSERNLRNIIEKNADAIVILNKKGIILFLNSASEYLFGKRKKELVGKLFGFPAVAGETTEIEVIRKNRSPLTAEMRMVNVDWEGESVYLASIRDITDRKKAEEQIRASLKEKEVMLQEIHHRVKNNMQIISSLLHLQSGYVKDKKSLEMLKESQNRVRTMAFIHEGLYKSKDLARIDFSGYVKSLTGHLFANYGIDSSRIKLKTNIEDISLGVNTAIPCGLIINELISNSLKHAFSDGRNGEIRIKLSKVNRDKFMLVVKDNGIGLPKDIDFRDTESLGLGLLNTLVGQLDGTVELDKKGGTTFKVIFPEVKYKKRS